MSHSPTAAEFHTPLQTPSGLAPAQQPGSEQPKKKNKKKKKKTAAAKAQGEPFREQYNEIAALRGPQNGQPLSNQKRAGDSAGNTENHPQGSHTSKVLTSVSRFFSNAVQT